VNIVSNRSDMAINSVNVALGAILFAAPWLFGFGHEAWASLNARLSGGIVILLALLAVLRTHDWEEWLNVIAGLWDVDDSYSSQMMITFYKGIASGKRPSSALRAAKLELMHSPNVSQRKPAYWAPYQTYLR